MVSFNRFVIGFLYLVLGLTFSLPAMSASPQCMVGNLTVEQALAENRATAGYRCSAGTSHDGYKCISGIASYDDRYYSYDEYKYQVDKACGSYVSTATCMSLDVRAPKPEEEPPIEIGCYHSGFIKPHSRCSDGSNPKTINGEKVCDDPEPEPDETCESLAGLSAGGVFEAKWCTSTDWNYCDDNARKACIKSCEAIFSGECPTGRRENQGMWDFYCTGQYIYSGNACPPPDDPEDPGEPGPDPNDPGDGTGDPDPGDPGTDPGDGKGGDGDPGGGSPGGGSPGGGGPGGDGGGSGGGDPGTIDPGNGGDTGDPNNGGNNPGGGNPDPGGNGNGGNGGGNGGNGTGTGDGGNGNGSGNGSGDGDGEGEETDPYCKQYPNDPRCKTGQFSGNCDLNFTCQGDPIFCATARATNELNCQYAQKPIPAELQEEIDEGLAFFNDLQEEESTIDWFSLLTFQREQGYCPSPEHVYVMGQDFVLSYDKLCEWSNIIGFVIMFAAAIVSIRVLAS